MLALIAWISLGIALGCALIIACDELRHPQKMAIMNIVWPVTALYFSVFALWAYLRFGRNTRTRSPSHQSQNGAHPRLTWTQVALATSHCGAGCVLADVVSEFGVYALGLTLFGLSLYASYAVDLGAAWLLGIVFQYFSIQPMRHLPAAQAIWAAIQADTLSILAFQIGMYAWMALSFFVLFPHPHLHPTQPQYWLMMQIAMVCGFLTAYPMNRWLVSIGIKEAMH